MNFNEKVYKLCKQIPKGKVSTYKEIAKAMNSKAYRAVGSALKKNSKPFKIDKPNKDCIPCHRIIQSSGSIGGFKGKTSGKHIKEKIRLLDLEGINIKNNKIIEFKKKLFKF